MNKMQTIVTSVPVAWYVCMVLLKDDGTHTGTPSANLSDVQVARGLSLRVFMPNDN